jgi:hypothetical protein
MSSFDPMAIAIDWLDCYRAADPSILDLYAPDAALECACDGAKTLIGRSAIPNIGGFVFPRTRQAN